MYKFIIKLADLKIYIHCHYQYCFNMCQDYIVNDKDYDFKISTNEDELLKENIPNHYNTELAVNISEDGTNYNIVNEVPTTGYELNSEKSICKTQTDTSGIENAPKDNNITIEYKEGKIDFLGITQKGTRCYLYFDLKNS